MLTELLYRLVGVRTAAEKDATRREWWLAHYKAAVTGQTVTCHGCTITPKQGQDMRDNMPAFRASYPYIRRYDEPTAAELAAMGL